jgi:hypothetical protein
MVTPQSVSSTAVSWRDSMSMSQRHGHKAVLEGEVMCYRPISWSGLVPTHRSHNCGFGKSVEFEAVVVAEGCLRST